jgi:hypothetical protein
LDFDPAVEHFEPQPIRIDLPFNGRTYVPDVLVRYRPELGRKPVLCEVKTQADLSEQWLELRPRLKAATRHCLRSGWIFRIFTEREIRTPYLQNVKLLREYRSVALNELEKLRLIKCVRDHHTITLGALLALYCPNTEQRGATLSLIWHLVATGALHADLSEVLTYSSELSVPARRGTS